MLKHCLPISTFTTAIIFLTTSMSVSAKTDGQFGLYSHSQLAQLRNVAGYSGRKTEKRQRHRARQFVRLYDLNGDGKVTVKEIVEDQVRMFRAIDIDDSNGLSPKEMRRRGSNLKIWRSVSIFDLLDDNANQEISAAELLNPMRRWFKRHDLNGDGVMEKSEIFHRIKRGKKGKKQRRRARKFLKLCDLNEDRKVTAAEIANNQKRILQALDINNNKSLSLKEIKRRGRGLKRCRSFRLFDLLDTNGDQQITIDELSAPMKRWFKRHDSNLNGMMEASEVPLHKRYRNKKRRRMQRRGLK